MRIPDPRADGPQLFATQFGRQSGSVESFNYTEANKKAAVHWDENTLFGESQVGHVSGAASRAFRWQKPWMRFTCLAWPGPPIDPRARHRSCLL